VKHFKEIPQLKWFTILRQWVGPISGHCDNDPKLGGVGTLMTSKGTPTQLKTEDELCWGVKDLLKLEN